MNLSDERDVLYERECPVCDTQSRIKPENTQSRLEDFPPPYKHDFDGGYMPASPALEAASRRARQELSDLDETMEILRKRYGKRVMDRQEGGNHYRNCPIQPVEYALANSFNYWESAALKYLTRHRTKNGAADLRKLIHCIELGLEQEYGETPYSSPQEALEQIVDRKDYIRRCDGRGNPEAS